MRAIRSALGMVGAEAVSSVARAAFERWSESWVRRSKTGGIVQTTRRPHDRTMTLSPIRPMAATVGTTLLAGDAKRVPKRRGFLF